MNGEAGQLDLIDHRPFLRNCRNSIVVSILSVLFFASGCAQQNATYQMNRANKANLESRALAEKSHTSDQRLDKINSEITAEVERLRDAVGRVEIQSGRCLAEADKTERKLAKKPAAKIITIKKSPAAAPAAPITEPNGAALTETAPAKTTAPKDAGSKGAAGTTPALPPPAKESHH